MGNNNVKIGIMAGVCVALIAAFFISTYVFNNKAPSTPPQQTVAAPGLHPGATSSAPQPGNHLAAAPAKPGAPMAAIPSRPGMPMAAAPTRPSMPLTAKPAGPVRPVQAVASKPGMGTPPSAGRPKMAMAPRQAPAAARPGGRPAPGRAGTPPPAQPNLIPVPHVPGIPMAAMIPAVFDPFVGGPKKIVPPPPVPVYWPPMEIAYKVSPALPQKLGSGTGPINVATIEAPLGRMAGWIYNNNAQIVAIFEDQDGITHSVRVGDSVGNLKVTAITPEYMVVVDDNGDKHTLKLQGLDTFGGKKHLVNVTPTQWAHRVPVRPI